MVCPSCGKENPEGFRFCGMCGATVVTGPPETAIDRLIGCLESGRHALAAEQERLRAEVKAEIAAGRKPERRREAVADVAPPEEPPVRRRVETPVRSETPVRPEMPVRSEQSPRRPISPSARPAFIYDHTPVASESVSGPSFLGLDAPTDPSYLLDEEPRRGHARAYLLLLFLAAVVVLAGLQWRSMKGEGIPNPFASTPAAQPSQPANTPSTAGSDLPNSEGAAQPAPNGATAAPSNAPNGQESAQPGQPSPQSTAGTNASDTNAQTDTTNNADGNAKAAPADKTNDSSKDGNDTNDETGSESPRSPQLQKESLRKPADMKPADQPLPTDAQGLWKASAAGNDEATTRLAGMYLTGNGVSRSCEQALLLLRPAAERGYAAAQIKLGALYSSGNCVKASNVSAYHWFSAALEQQPRNRELDRIRRMVWARMTDHERDEVAQLTP